MTTITEFLTARWDEDEAVAREATDGPWAVRPNGDSPWVIRDGRPEVWLAITSSDPGAPRAANADHIALHDPTRVLADIAAKRAIVGLHPATGWRGRKGREKLCETCGDPDGWDQAEPVDWPCPTLRTLAQPYAEHPDYDPDWRVG